jgi:hypothetical protein
MTILAIALALSATAPASLPDTGKCDAKPFTLGKPAAARAKPSAEAVKVKPQPKVAASKSAAEKPRLLATCKTPPAKKAG